MEDCLIGFIADRSRREIVGVDGCSHWSRLDHRMDRRDRVAHISEIGAAYNLMVVCGVDIATEADRVGHVPIKQSLIVTNLVVAGLDQFVAHRAATRQRTSLKTGNHTSRQGIGTGTVGRTYIPAGCRPFGHDVGPPAGIGEDPVDPLLRSNVLPEGSNVHVAEDRCIECVETALGSCRSMCRPAGEYRLNLLDGKAGDVSQICVSGVHHQCSLNIVERPPFEHQNLATATLLGRSAEDANTSTKLCRYGGGGQTGPQTGRGDDVVTTGVTDSGQSVVFAQNRYQRSLASSCCLERCLEAVCGPDYVHSFGLEHPCKEFVCEVFLKPEFRLGVYLMRCGDQGVSQIIDLLKDPLSCPNHGCVVCHRRIVPLQPGPIVTGVQAGSDDKAQHGRFHTHGDVSVGTDRFRIKVDRHWMPERHLHRRLSRVGDAGMRQVGTGV